MKNKILIGLGAIIVFGSIGAFIGDGEETAEGENNTDNSIMEETNSNNDTDEPTLEEYLTETIYDISGTDTYRDDYPEPIHDIHINDTTVELTLMSQDYETADAAAYSEAGRSEEYFQTILPERDDVEELDITWLFPNDGELIEVLVIIMTEETESNVDWSDFRRTDFPEVADMFWEIEG